MMRPLFLRAAILGLMTAPCLAADLYVDANLSTGANDGSTWSNAFQGSNGLQAALAASTSGDRIFAAQGTYKPTTGASRFVSFAMKNGVEIYGGFVGTETSPFQRPAIGTAVSILDGDLAGNDGSNLFNDNSYHLISTGGVNATAVIDGFQVRGGNANGSGNNNTGGGILCLGNVRPTIRNCHFIDNRCTFGGGAGYINGATPTFTDTIFENNIGGSFGGAFDMAGAGAVRFERCQFIGNRAARAGALESFSSSGVVISNCLFVGNIATGGSGGGGLWFGNGGSAQVRNCTVVGNSSPAQAQGAGLRDQGTSLTIVNSIFFDNIGPGGTQTSTNQISGNAATYCMVEGGLAGVGNIGTAPTFTDAGNGDYSLTTASAGVDAGNNAGVATGVSFDIRFKRRYEDIVGVADTGSGTAPLVDIGAYEASTSSGTFYCTANNNSTGTGAQINTTGSSVVANNSLSLIADGMPNNQFGIFITGTEPNFVSGPGGSSGNLCVGGLLGRFNRSGEIFDTGMVGSATLALDLNNIPSPTGPTSIVAGETWYFQAWFRDNVIGFPTSNFTDAVTIEFE